MKTLFLHIGTSKTATTAIQQFCADNRDLLEGKGFCFPESVYKYPLVSPNRNAHFMIGNIMGEDGKTDKAEKKRLLKLGFDNLNMCFFEYDNVILSDESIWWASGTYRKSVFKNLKEDMDKNGYVVKLIVYLRRQDDFLCSRWNQMVKKENLTETWEEHFKSAPDKMDHVLDYAAKINMLAEMFGKENIIVRRFHRKGFYQGTIFADFLHCIGLELTDGFVLPEAEVNLAIKGNTVEVMRVMNTAPVITRYNKAYLSGLVSMCSEESDKYYKYTMISKEEATEFLERYREGNEQIAADFIGDGKPLFDYGVGTDLPKWEKDNAYMMDDVIRIFTVITQDLHEEVERLKKENEQLKKENERIGKEFAKLKSDTKKDIQRIKLFIWKVKHPFRFAWSKLTGRELRQEL